MGKDLFLSKTFITNTIALLVAIAGGFGIDIGLDAETQAALVISIMAVGNIILRLFTKEPITSVGKIPQ